MCVKIMPKHIAVKEVCSWGDEVTKEDAQPIVSMGDPSEETVMRHYREEEIARVLER
jgi:hypothetical protein